MPLEYLQVLCYGPEDCIQKWDGSHLTPNDYSVHIPSNVNACSSCGFWFAKRQTLINRSLDGSVILNALLRISLVAYLIFFSQDPGVLDKTNR